MSREIIFRGKSEVTNEWVYGSLVKVGNESHIVGFDEVDLDGHHLSYCSDRPIFTKQGTIGQFTGLHDKNGKEIYEGDIVEYDWYIISDKPAYRTKEQVTFDDTGARLGNDRIRNCLNVEVIANIHENPDLLWEK